MEYSCVGFLELDTITRGFLVADALLKKASVNVIFSHPISSGKYIIGFHGEVDDVKSSLATGKKVGASSLVDWFILPLIHSTIIPAINKKMELGEFESFGILETATCASCIVAADAALKTSKVRLVKLHLGQGIGGKAYFVLEGAIGEIESAMHTVGRELKKRKSTIVDQVIISQGTPEIIALF